MRSGAEGNLGTRLFLIWSVAVVCSAADKPVDFDRDIRPILSYNCFACHGPDDTRRMPPPQSGTTLTDAQIELLRKWIEQGARWERHWAFVAPQAPALPAVREERWPRNPIDRFVLARLEREGLKPSPEADRTTLLRRLS